MKKLRILFVHATLEVGGAEELRLTILKYLDLNKFDVEICCISEKGQIGEEIEKLGIKFHILNRSKRWFDFGTTVSLYRLLRKRHYDVVQSSLSPANWHTLIACKFTNIPSVICEEHSYEERYNKKLGIVFRKFNRFFAKYCHYIIVPSNFVASKISDEEGIPIDKFKLIYNAIDPLKFEVKESKHMLRTGYNFPLENKVLIYVATLSKIKGHIYLLKAFEDIIRYYPDIKLVLVGDGPLKKELASYTRSRLIHHNVLFLGCRRDIPKLLKCSDIFISPTLVEGFGINLLEAMYMGLPCIASNVGGIPEIITHDYSGLLVRPGNPSELRDKIVKLIEDKELADRLGKAGQKSVKERFLPSLYVQKLEQLWKL